MKAIEIMEELFTLADERDYSNTCDTLKAGNPDVEVKKVAVFMHPTLEVKYFECGEVCTYTDS